LAAGIPEDDFYRAIETFEGNLKETAETDRK